LKDPLDDQAFKPARPDSDRHIERQRGKSAGNRRAMPGRPAGGNLARLLSRDGGAGNRDDEVKSGEAMARRGNVKSARAVNDDTSNQRIDANMANPRARFELTLYRRETPVAPLPSLDFDTNSVRRLVDDDRAGHWVQ
jgi:hypothetical protein